MRIFPRCLHALVGLLLVSISAVAANATDATAHSTATLEPPPADVTGSAESAAATAVAEARRAGRRIEIADQTSETRQVFANPDGTFTAEVHVEPVRVRRGSGWSPVDTTLRKTAQGLVSPVASPAAVEFSGGGTTAPLVRLVRGDRQLALVWPGPLPAPMLESDTATYPEVLPDVDLRLRASVHGYSMVLVVKSAAAASNPRLERLRLGLSTKGVTVDITESVGNLVARDASGRAVFSAPVARMWESSAGQAPASATGANADARVQARSGDQGGRRVRVEVEAGADFLTVVPDRKLLRDPSTRFPVYIDPDFNAGLIGWGEVVAQHPQDSYWGGDGEPVAKVGYSNWEWPNVTYRSYFLFDIGWLRGAQVFRAEFNAREVWAPSCSPRWVDLYHVGPIGPGLTWNNQPWAHYLAGQNVAWGYVGCGPNWVGWDATGGVTGALGSGSSGVAFMLRAANESDPYAWKKFETNPRLIVNYNWPPNVPTGLSVDPGFACVHEPDEPYIGEATPTVRATASDRDNEPMGVTFEWWHRGGALVGSKDTVKQPSGSPFSATIPPGAFNDGSKIAWRARSFDGKSTSTWSEWCDMTVDLVAPDKQPAVSSGLYPENDFGGAIGKTGLFTFDANGATDVKGFRYGLFDSTPDFVTAQSLGGSATAAVTPPTDGPQDLYVRSVDRAGNLGPVTRYHFLVGTGTPPRGQWRLDGHGTARTATDSSGLGHHGTLTGTAGWATGRVGDAVTVDGSSGHVSTSGGPAVRTDGSFSVTAWVKPAASSGWRAAVSQDGSRVSGFFLQHTDAGKWAFTLPRADADDPAWDRVVSDVPVVPGVWAHLTGVYDKGKQEIRLYVNGRFAGSAPHTTPWHFSTGNLQIGRAKFNGNPTDYWAGAVDEVRVYDRVLSDGRNNPGDEVSLTSEVHALASAPAVEEGWWGLDETSGTTSVRDLSGSFRNATPAGGVTFGPGPVGSAAAQFDGTGFLSTSAPAVRTDRTFTVTAWARLAESDGSQRTVVSQDGVRGSGFHLGYDGETKKWVFRMPTADTDTSGRLDALSTEPARAGEWTHLAGVYDAARQELRLYVNGTQTGSVKGEASWNATGAVQIGRAKSQGAPSAWWSGWIDDVHLYTGARTADQIKAALDNPVAAPRTPYDGQMTRWNSHNGDHFTASGSLPAGYHTEGSLGWFAAEGAQGTRTLYMCRTAADEFTSGDPQCEGEQRLGELGRVYTSAPSGMATHAVYRCNADGEHFDSIDPGCEGAKMEALLGHTRAYRVLVRYGTRGAPDDHASTSFGLPGGYQPDGALGLIAGVNLAGTVSLMACRQGADEYTSAQADCEGGEVVRELGRIWADLPTEPGFEAQPLWRCVMANTGERFDSLEESCEGQERQTRLGYVLIPQ